MNKRYTSENGATLVEYSLLIALIAATIILSARYMGENFAEIFTFLGQVIGG